MKIQLHTFLAVSVLAVVGLLASPLIVPANIAHGQYAVATCNSAVLNGHIEPNGAPTQVWFEWGAGNSITYSTPRQTFTSSANFSANINSLTENSLYSYRAMAVNQNGASTGQTLTFRTNICTQQTPTVNLTANPSSIQSGQSSILSWNSNNATSCTLSQFGTVPTSGSRTVTPGSTTTYSITCTNNTGQSATDTATVSVNTQQQLPEVRLSANPSSIQSGQHSTLSWNSNNATRCSAFWTYSTATSGSEPVSPSSTTTYLITCYNSSGQSATDSVTVYVNQTPTNNPTVNITADDTTIDSGDSTIVRWNSQNANYCVASGGSSGWAGTRTLSGSFPTGSLTNNKTYSITCSNNSGSASDSVTIRVEDINDEDVSVDISADHTSVNSGDSTTIRWDSDNADDCRATGGSNGWSGNRNTSGTFRTGSLYSDTTYRIRCTNDDGDSDEDSVTVRVNENNNICRDITAINYLGNLPCRYTVINNQPTVVLTADSTNIAYNGSTTIRWNTTNATSCFASGGSLGWAGAKSIGPGSFFTGSLTGTRTYSITCSNSVGSASDSVTVSVRGQVLGVTTTPSAYLVVNSSVDRNRPIVPTLDNTNPCPGDEINYTLTYQNVGNGSVRNLILRVDLPFEVTYLSSSPSNPTISGNTLIFNLGTLGANKSGTVAIRVLLRDNVQPGTNLNFPATLNYVDPSGSSQSVSANVSANVCGVLPAVTASDVTLGASVFGAGFLPTSIFGWLLLLILILILILLARHLFNQSFQKRTITTYEDPNLGKRTTTTTTL